MKFTIRSLTVALKQATITIPFAGVTYFHGRMGAGKTSIARLIDYCLGGELDPSPALQSEFVEATLRLELENSGLQIERARDSDRVVATWTDGDGEHRLSIPARRPSGVVLPGTEVEHLSDLIFHLAGVTPPRVRTSKTRDDSELRRLSLRDLLWYCYLDQDEIDSTFFHLDKRGDFKQLKSRDVLRFVLNFHNERVAEIEAEIERLRGERLALTSSVEGFRRALEEVRVESEEDLQLRIEALRNQADGITTSLDQLRGDTAAEIDLETNAVDSLRVRARQFGERLSEIDADLHELRELQDQARLHLHEVETLTLKFRRSTAAKDILQGVTFTSCPRCTQPLPERPASLCPVCGQQDEASYPDAADMLMVERDAKGRIDELKDVIDRRERGMRQLERGRERVVADKNRVERELVEATRVYDSAYLSRALSLERDRASLYEQASSLERLARLPRLVAAQRLEIERIAGKQNTLREDLRSERAAAERDDSNLELLGSLFLDCLLRTSLPGIASTDQVQIGTNDFLPRVLGPEAVEESITSFSNMSSGGKKTLFKSCFAVAVHRLAVRIGAILPELLIIDSPMKNISERENWEQFEGFHEMLYQLKLDELRETQLILIDKEYFPPDERFDVDLLERHMQPNEADVENPYPPLIPYYFGH